MDGPGVRGTFALLRRPFTALLLTAACGPEVVAPPPLPPPPPPPPPAVPTTIVLSSAQVTLTWIGETQQVTATVRDQRGEPLAVSITWSIDNSAVATVSADGVITAAGNGTATVTAAAGAAVGTVAVTVQQAPSQISLAPANVTLRSIGATAQLTATVNDAGGAGIPDSPVTWASSSQAVATVSTTGTVTAVSAGTATITATAGTATATASVAVQPTPVAQVRIAAPATDLHEGAATQLTVAVTDASGGPVTGRAVIWTSDAPNIATVDGTGLVRALKPGVVRIRASVDGIEDTRDLPVRGLLHRWTFSESGGPGTVFHDDVGGAQASIVGVGPFAATAVAGQVTLTGGPRFSADYVALPPGLLRTRTDATIEFWATVHSLKHWGRIFDIGTSSGNYFFAAWSQATIPGTDRTGFAINGIEHRVDNALAPFTIDVQHHIVITIDDDAGGAGKTRVSLYLDGQPRGTFETSYRLGQLNDNEFWLGRSHYPDETANASYDEVRIHDWALSADDVLQVYLRGPVRSSPATSISIITPAGIRDTVRGVGVRFQARAIGRDALGRQFPVAGGRWSSSNPAVATVDSAGTVRTHDAGRTEITVTASGATARWTADIVRIRRVRVDPYLATPISGARWEVPVVLIEYLPTADGSGIDVTKVPDFGALNPMALDAAEALVLQMTQRRKMMVEQGSRFRGYRDAAAVPSLGYRVVEHIIVYDQIPPHPTKRHPAIPGGPRFENWHATFADLQLEPLMRARTVREVWVAWSSFDGNYPVYDPATFRVEDMRAGWESNMSSPVTGDISNSDRDPADAPVLSHTYIIYGINFRRSQAEAVHNVGHQLEAMLSYVATRQDGNVRLFWRDFVGQNAQGQLVTGRAGWTHMPPNTIVDYDYLNRAQVSSDIEDWRPDNTGQKKLVNVDTWGNLTYPWPGAADFGQRVESQWYTYWFQNFPGLGNRIPHGANWMTNWWAFVADWDAAIASGLGLHAATPAAAVGAAPYRYGAPPKPAAVPHRQR